MLHRIFPFHLASDQQSRRSVFRFPGRTFYRAGVHGIFVAQAWKITTATMAITANMINVNVPDGVFISAIRFDSTPARLQAQN